MKPYPLGGSTMIARGLAKFEETRVRLSLPFILAT